MTQLIFWGLSCVFATLSIAQAKELIPVEVGVLEALAESEASPSDRYKEQYQAALFYSIGQTEEKINRCGYHYKVIERYFDSSDKVQAQKFAAELKSLGAWFVFSPRRSDHFLAALNGMGGVPAISPMANANTVTLLPPPAFTTYPSISDHAEGAVKAVIKEKYGKRYASAVDPTCPSCRDFESAFYDASQGKLERKFKMELIGNGDEHLPELIAKLKESPVDFLVLPNFAELSGNVILKLQKIFPDLKYVGGDAWGDGRTGYFNQFGFNPITRGFCIRAGLGSDEMKKLFKVHSLDRNWTGSFSGPSNSTFYMVHFFREMADILCSLKPKDRSALTKYLSGQKRNRFKVPQGLSVFKLENSKLGFSYPLK